MYFLWILLCKIVITTPNRRQSWIFLFKRVTVLVHHLRAVIDDYLHEVKFIFNFFQRCKNPTCISTIYIAGKKRI